MYVCDIPTLSQVDRRGARDHATQAAEILAGRQNHTTPPDFFPYRQARGMSSIPTFKGHAGRESILVDANTILLVLLPARLPASAWHQADALICAWRETRKEREKDGAKGMSNILYVHESEVVTEDGEEWPICSSAIPFASSSPLVDEHASAFHTTNLDFRLRRAFSRLLESHIYLPLKHLVIAGAGADTMVESSVRNAADLGYIATYVTDAVSGESREREARTAYVSRKKGKEEEGKERERETKSKHYRHLPRNPSFLLPALPSSPLSSFHLFPPPLHPLFSRT